MLLATVSSANTSAGYLTEQITRSDSCKFLMPYPKPQIWCTPQHLMLLKKPGTHLSICLGPFAGIAWGLLEKMHHWPELFLAVRKGRVKSGNDWPTLLDEVWNSESCRHTHTHTLLVFNTSSIWLNGSKTFQWECGAYMCEKQRGSLFTSPCHQPQL